MLLATGTVASGSEPELPPAERVVFDTTVMGRANPIGVNAQGRLTYKQRIGHDPDLLWRTRFWSVSGSAGINPANWTATLAAEVEPIAILQLRLQYEARGFFGTFNNVLSGASAALRITDKDIEQAGARGDTAPAAVHALTVQPTLQAALGPVAVQEIVAVTYNGWSVPEDRIGVYDPALDMLVPAQGLLLSHTALLAWRGSGALVAAVHMYTAPLMLEDNDVHRVGLFTQWNFHERAQKQGWLHTASVSVASLFNVQHRGRGPLVPTVMVFFTTESDVL